ncbi:type II toxin-antitoxin system VapC family toxin [Vineibacter terrae]|uniref:Type II toxin-antitoxin system VapC family toxin n=1 Tax=Vineibacter terrae TaxID=2586908 RepID=A0A5C8PI97_9HYPH|nr:PIN domain-containing protein [Vineibacter terrae]TXL73421.1 type II toxin-antitoxin system VapC family toxin [Vineibacter terrae]
MKITADTNILLRAIVADGEAQSKVAIEALENADMVAICLHSLCELAWVLARQYQIPRADIAEAIRRLIGRNGHGEPAWDYPAGEGDGVHVGDDMAVIDTTSSPPAQRCGDPRTRVILRRPGPSFECDRALRPLLLGERTGPRQRESHCARR